MNQKIRNYVSERYKSSDNGGWHKCPICNKYAKIYINNTGKVKYRHIRWLTSKDGSRFQITEIHE